VAKEKAQGMQKTLHTASWEASQPGGPWASHPVLNQAVRLPTTSFHIFPTLLPHPLPPACCLHLCNGPFHHYPTPWFMDTAISWQTHQFR